MTALVFAALLFAWLLSVNAQYNFSHSSLNERHGKERRDFMHSANNKFRRFALSGACTSNRNQSIVPSQVIVFGISQGATISLGETGLVLVRFPDGVCNIPNPGDIPDCNPLLILNVAAGGMDYVILSAEPRSSDVEADYKVRFADQPELTTASGSTAQHWVFIGKVSLGLNTPDLKALAMLIPAGCNTPEVSFYNDFFPFPSGALVPSGIKFDTVPPMIQGLFTTGQSGNFTAGHIVEITIKFSKPVRLSDLPDRYSQVYLDAQATSTILYGVPYIELNSGALVALRGYDSAADKSKLSFVYLVGNGEQTPAGIQLDIAANTTIQLNGGSITGDGNGLDADLTSMPAYGTKGQP